MATIQFPFPGLGGDYGSAATGDQFPLPGIAGDISDTPTPPAGGGTWYPRPFDQTLFRPLDFEIPKARSATWSTQVPPPVPPVVWVPRGFDPYLHQARFPHIDIDRPRILIGAAIRPRTQIAGNILSMRQTSPNAVTIYMPPSAAIGKPYIITDTLGVCGSYNFTIATSGGATITTMTTDGASRGLYWDGFGWVVFLKS